MIRKYVVSSAQMGPISRQDTRQDCVNRMLEMMKEAAAKGSRFIVFPELALTSFFPRWIIEDQAELDTWFETSMPNAISTVLLAVSLVVVTVFFMFTRKRY